MGETQNIEMNACKGIILASFDHGWHLLILVIIEKNYLESNVKLV